MERPGTPDQAPTRAAVAGCHSGRKDERGGCGWFPCPHETPVRYRVKRGDTLWEIARAHDATPEELRRWDDLTQRAKLRVGQELTIHPSRS